MATRALVSAGAHMYLARSDIEALLGALTMATIEMATSDDVATIREMPRSRRFR